jgi:gamma-glutamylcyclotransferase (GGCT)/AIG2-like uncharacterized protein YtfP
MNHMGTGDLPVNRPDLFSHLFVYGSLLSDRPAHAVYLSGPDCHLLGKAVLGGYDLYDLGPYPAILRRPHAGVFPAPAPACVYGECYRIGPDTLRRIDEYEGEGSLYDRRRVAVRIEDRSFEAYTYLFRRDISADQRVALGLQPWKADTMNQLAATHVWYAAYGSNLLRERFLVYLQGGRFRNRCKKYNGCKDRRPPLADHPYLIGRQMYYGNETSSWGDGGVCFWTRARPAGLPDGSTSSPVSSWRMYNSRKAPAVGGIRIGRNSAHWRASKS